MGLTENMPVQQLHLFAPVRPLLQRFGDEFFRAVPARPGVYIMGGEADRVLYIGQSKNLRHRLGAYKNARIDRVPRKIIRFVHLVRSIVWEECPTAHAARLKENQLLRTHRPKFNVQNTFPMAYQFIWLKIEGTHLEIGVGSKPDSGGEIYGAFKAGCIHAYGALLRLIWTAAYQPVSVDDFPAALLGSRPPRPYRLCGNLEFALESLKRFLSGESDALIEMLRQRLPPAGGVSAFQRNLQSNDMEVLANFYERGPRRNRVLRAQYEIPTVTIPQLQLDDLLVMADEVGIWRTSGG